MAQFLLVHFWSLQDTLPTSLGPQSPHTSQDSFSVLKKSYSSSRGFTLIELIVSIGIIAIIATIVFTTLRPLEQFQKANDSKRKSDLAQIQRVLESYYQDHGKYPDYDTSTYKIKDASGNSILWGGSWTPYIDVLPKDPVPTNNYVYKVDQSGYQTYWLYASLERGAKDPQVCNSGNKCSNAPVGGCGGGVVCNYGVNSPNTSP